jgi:hypothetical protein
MLKYQIAHDQLNNNLKKKTIMKKIKELLDVSLR